GRARLAIVFVRAAGGQVLVARGLQFLRGDVAVAIGIVGGEVLGGALAAGGELGQRQAAVAIDVGAGQGIGLPRVAGVRLLRRRGGGRVDVLVLGQGRAAAEHAGQGQDGGQTGFHGCSSRRGRHGRTAICARRA